MRKANLTQYIMVYAQSRGSFSFFQIILCYINLTKAKLKKIPLSRRRPMPQNYTSPLVDLYKYNRLSFVNKTKSIIDEWHGWIFC